MQTETDIRNQSPCQHHCCLPSIAWTQLLLPRMRKQAKQAKNKVLVMVLKICGFCIWCFEKCVWCSDVQMLCPCFCEVLRGVLGFRGSLRCILPLFVTPGEIPEQVSCQQQVAKGCNFSICNANMYCIASAMISACRD